MEVQTGGTGRKAFPSEGREGAWPGGGGLQQCDDAGTWGEKPGRAGERLHWESGLGANGWPGCWARSPKGLSTRMAGSSPWAEGDHTFTIQPGYPRVESKHNRSHSQPAAQQLTLLPVPPWETQTRLFSEGSPSAPREWVNR